MIRGHVPMRTCKGCGARLPQKELQRLVCRQGKLVISEKGPGRAVYCCRDGQCRDRLLKNKKVLKRAFRLQT
jgi:predicted RNA-binding protein YlxR (DUF448 family)